MNLSWDIHFSFDLYKLERVFAYVMLLRTFKKRFIYVHCECVHWHSVHLHTGTQFIRLHDVFSHIIEWCGACGKRIEESVKIEDMLSWGERFVSRVATMLAKCG